MTTVKDIRPGAIALDYLKRLRPTSDCGGDGGAACACDACWLDEAIADVRSAMERAK